MSINLLDLLKDQVTGTLAKEAGSFLGSSESNITGALDGIFPSLLGSLIDKGSSESGASGIMDMIGGLDLGMLDNISNVFGGDSSNVTGLLSSGGGIIDSLLGDKLGGIVDVIAKMSGLGGSTTSSLIKLAAPFLLGKIGGLVKDNGISFLMELLSGQKDHVAAAMPAGMGSILGLSSLGSTEGIKDTLGAIVDKGEDVLAGATAMAGDAGDLAGDAIEKVGDVIGGAATLAGDTAGKVGGAATAAVGGAAALAGDTVGKVGGAATAAASSGLGFLKWLLPFALIAAAAYFILGKGCSGVADDLSDATSGVVDQVGEVAGGAADMAGDAVNAAGDAVNAAGEMASDAVDATGDAVNAAGGAITNAAAALFGKVDETAKTALDKISFSANSAGSQMMDFIAGKREEATFRFNNLTYATGSANIDPASVSEVDNIAAILKAYPDVNIEIQGHTDNTGDAAGNISLSQARAESVKGRLQVEGIDASRISAKGYGQNNPTADNSTAEGRKQNRRIEIKVVAK